MTLEILRDLIFVFMGIGLLVFRKPLLNYWKWWFSHISWMKYTPLKEQINTLGLWILGILVISASLFHLVNLLIPIIDSVHPAPIIGLLLGVLILIFVGYINWYGNIKVISVRWLAKKMFRNALDSKISANNLFMTATSLLLALGGIIVVYSIYIINLWS